MNNDVKECRKISLSEMPADIPDYVSSFEPKDSLIKKWIINWILSSVSKNSIKENDIIPSKSELSKHLGVSVGTIQNAIRYVEDEGYLKSKQRLGTMISNFTNPINQINKSTSKRDKTIFAIKKYIIQKDLMINKPMPSTRKMSDIIGISPNTIRLAYEFLSKEGILQSSMSRGNDSNWILVNYPKLNAEDMKISDDLTADTLVDKISTKLKEYFSSGFNIGDKIPSQEQLASELNVSVKTIHDCILKLSNQGILISRRGKYGTILAQNPSEKVQIDEMFVDAQEAAFYSYQKIETEIIKYIKTECKIGDKLPSMKDLSLKFNVSTNTIRKSLSSIAEQGYITFSRGKYGGTFIVDIPETQESQSYQWLSINPEYI